MEQGAGIKMQYSLAWRIREGLSEEVTLRLRLVRCEAQEKSVPSQGKSRCKGPEGRPACLFERQKCSQHNYSAMTSPAGAGWGGHELQFRGRQEPDQDSVDDHKGIGIPPGAVGGLQRPLSR